MSFERPELAVFGMRIEVLLEDGRVCTATRKYGDPGFTVLGGGKEFRIKAWRKPGGRTWEKWHDYL